MKKSLLLSIGLLLSSAALADEPCCDNTAPLHTSSSQESVVGPTCQPAGCPECSDHCSTAATCDDSDVAPLVQDLREHIDAVQAFDVAFSINRCDTCSAEQWQEICASVTKLDELLSQQDTAAFREAFAATVTSLASMNGTQKITEGRLTFGWELAPVRRKTDGDLPVSREFVNQQNDTTITRAFVLHKEEVDAAAWGQFCQHCLTMVEKPDAITPATIADVAVEVIRLQTTAHNALVVVDQEPAVTKEKQPAQDAAVPAEQPAEQNGQQPA